MTIKGYELEEAAGQWGEDNPRFVWEQVYRLARWAQRDDLRGLAMRRELDAFGRVGVAAVQALEARAS